MAKLYTFLMLVFCLPAATLLASETDPPNNPTHPDSAAIADMEGHLRCTTHVKINCMTKTIELSAHLDHLFTGLSEPASPTWSTGVTQHKIIVVPPGSWSWDVTGFGCDHITTAVEYDDPFFMGQIDITGPPGICSGEQFVTLNVNTQGYNFENYTWSPSNDPLSPIIVDQSGTYALTVYDGMGCPFMDQVTLPEYPPFVPTLTAPQYICPEGGMGTVNVTQPYASYEWSTGDTGNPLQITEPGLYEVTVTNTNGCTGASLIGVQSGGIESVLLSATKPAICPGQLDTLRVLGAFLNIQWSNGVTTNNNIVNMPGTYSVTVTNIHGCTSETEYTIAAVPTPVVQTSAPPLCSGSNTIITASGGSFPNYQWSQGGTTSSITVTSPGLYTVTVTGPNICPATSSVNVQLATPPIATAAPPGQLTCTNTQLTLDGTGSSSGANFVPVWTTIGGNIVSGDSSLMPVVNGAGSYLLTMTNISNGCTDTVSVTVAQNVQAPVANAGMPSTLSCIVDDVVIGPSTTPANPNWVPVWTTANGSFVSGQNSWNPLVNGPGTYVLTVNDTLLGCSSNSSVTIGQNITPPVAAIAAPGQLSCVINTMALDGSGSSSGANFTYQWSTANGSISGPANSITATAASIGTYQLLVTNTQTGCTASTTTTVTSSVTLPVAVAAPPAVLNCLLDETSIDANGSSAGPEFTYSWTTTNGTIESGNTSLMPTVSAPGTYNLLLTNTTNNCTATLNVIVDEDIMPPLANAGPNVVLNCTTNSIALDGSGSASGAGITYQWTTSIGNILSGDQTVAPIVDAVGDYDLLVTNTNNGCTSTATVLAQGDFAPPVIDIATPEVLTCVTTMVQVDGNGSSQGTEFTYEWSGTGIISGQGTPQITVDQPGTFVLLITDNNNGCTKTSDIEVSENISAPDALAGPDLLLNCTTPTGTIGSSMNPSGAAFIIEWSTVGGNFTTPTNGPTANIDQAGTYQVVVTANINGCTSTDEMVVTEDFAAPLADAGNTAELTCTQNVLNLSGSGSMGNGFAYLWSTPNGNITGDPATLNPQINAAGVYNLLVTNTVNGCTSTDQVTITQSADVPVAIAGAPQTLTCAVLSATLNAAGSTPGLTYSWTTSTGNIVSGNGTLTPVVDNPGTYVLTVLNTANNCSAVSSVIVNENVQAPALTGAPDQVLTCTQTSLLINVVVNTSFSPNLTYQWSTANGNIVSGGSTAMPTVDAIGTYITTVTDNANGCTSTAQVLVGNDVNQPVALIAAPETLTCNLDLVSLNTGGSSLGNNFQYDWTTPDGNFQSLADPSQPVVDQPGTYNLLITNTDNGCTETATVNVPQDIAAPAAEAGPAAVLNCDSTILNLNGNGSSAGAGFIYQWSTDIGEIISGAQTLSPEIIAPGTYTILVENTQNGCTRTDNVVITQDIVPPSISTAVPGVLTCLEKTVILSATAGNLGNAPTITWTTPSGNIISGGNTLTPTVDLPGLYLITIENSTNGCTATAPVNVIQDVVNPQLQLLPPAILTCTVQQVTLSSTASPQVVYNWTTTNGSIVSGANTGSAVVNTPGIYTLNITSTVTGCTASSQIPVVQEANVPTGFTFSLDPPLCNGTPGSLIVNDISGGIGPYQYSINGGQTFFPASDIGNLKPGEFDLVVRDVNGCEIEEPISVPEPPQPLVSLPPTFQIKLGENQELEAIVPSSFPFGMIDTVIWSPTDGLTFTGTSIAELLNPVATPYKTTKYEVTIITPEGCQSVSRTIIEVDRRIQIYAPNVIDVYDNNNNTFLIFSNDESVKEIKWLQIFDRWGAMVFENREFQPNDVTAGWTGDHKGQLLDPAVFAWQAEVLLVDGTSILLTGDVTVVR